ncbi:GDSL-type esterase/lipase family protein [Streptomyces sp. DSM 40750]|uniref:GDSL-type esterase/lipase family protein n=1 Tax=Streptomyces sp. DSM 40750 TaxID=2801030 RepID=UPI00214CE375|nr:GDSL-type esterase/lipase family protein [Streptomyces sp. DSM 40750]UUU19306.1 GDSL-type esterase/lipase family protein [Streptomyces sp. DSM 40750]UUU27351.1 GDSL-type esterase/lipase family protein [Streptomyces sp. DSM 40750]
MALAAAVVATLAVLVPAAPVEAAGQQAWTGTWATAQHASYDPGTSEVTVRIPVRVSAGGSSVRIRLTNGFTAEPVTIRHATVGHSDGGAAVAKPYGLRFGGEDEVTIAAGEQAVSDPLRLPVRARGDLVVSLYFPGRLTHVSQHWMGLQTVYWTPDGGGDHAGDADGDAFTRTDSTFPFLTGVDVRGGDAAGSVVALGDSITDGASSTANTNRRWPDYLAARLSACSTTAGVLNEGISGNRITAGTDGNPSALDRLERDVLSQPGARTVILFEGVNDLSWGGASGDQVIDGMKEIARRSHARGLRVIGATVVPYRGWGDWWTEAKEADRQRVNAFVRDSGGVLDGYADFDEAVRDPDDPTRYAAAFDSGDHLHPNDTGMKAFSDAVDLAGLGVARDCPSARVRLTPYRPSLEAGGRGTEITSTVTNTGPTTVTQVTTGLDLPDGWLAEPAGSPRIRSLAPGDSAAVTWTVTPAADAAWGTHPVAVNTSFRQDGRIRRDSDSVDATVTPVPSEVRSPYRTTDSTTEDAQYAQNGGQFAIWAGGQDLSGWKDEKATVYLADAAGPSGTVIARVAGQTGSGPSAKAGIAVANDLTAPEAGGYAVLTMSKQYGLEFLTDSDGDGKLDTWAGGGSSYHPAWLKLVRDGSTYTAYAGPDGTAWQRVATATVPSASGTGDAGLVASAVNLNYPGQTTTALFDSFSTHE